MTAANSATGADAWRADGEVAGRRMFIKIFTANGMAGTGRTDWCWEVAEADDGSWVSRATGAEPSREAAIAWVEEAAERGQNEDRRDRLRRDMDH